MRIRAAEAWAYGTFCRITRARGLPALLLFSNKSNEQIPQHPFAEIHCNFWMSVSQGPQKGNN